MHLFIVCKKIAFLRLNLVYHKIYEKPFINTGLKRIIIHRIL